MTPASLDVLAWLGTYLVHSSAFLLGVFLLVLALRPRPRLRAHLWQLGLVAGLVTAVGQHARGVDPWFGRLGLASETLAEEPRPATPESRSPRLLPREARRTAPRPEASPPRELQPAATTVPATVAVLPPPARSTTPNKRPPLRPTEPVHVTPATRRRSPSELAVLALGACSLLGAASVLFQGLLLTRRLRQRRPLAPEDLPVDLARLASRAGLGRSPRVFVVDHLEAPLTAGCLRPAIYLPPRALQELDPDKLTSLLAHELAHVAHRDPARFTLAALFERVLFFQPLHRLARRRLVEAAEEAADEAAVRHGGGALSLAACLTAVAGWRVGRTEPAGAWAAPALGRSSLGRRVERLLESSGDPLTRERTPLRWTPLGAMALGVGVLALPGLSARTPAPSTPPTNERPADPTPPRPETEPVTPLPDPAPEPAPAPDPEPTATTTPTPLALEHRLLGAEITSLADQLEELHGALDDLGIDPSEAPSLGRLDGALRNLRSRYDELERRITDLDPR